MIRFLAEAIRNYRQTGAVAPSSRGLAESMVLNIHTHDQPRRILEVGSGTGAFTRRILDRMEDGDRLDAIEINQQFAEALDLDLLEPFRTTHPGSRVQVLCSAIEEAELDGPYDLVVCGLPFNNFPLDMTRRIFDIMLSVLHPTGWLSYFEYVGMRPLKFPFVGGAGRSHLREHGTFLANLERAHNGYRRLITLNIPPAWSVHLQGGISA